MKGQHLNNANYLISSIIILFLLHFYSNIFLQVNIDDRSLVPVAINLLIYYFKQNFKTKLQYSGFKVEEITVLSFSRR